MSSNQGNTIGRGKGNPGNILEPGHYEKDNNVTFDTDSSQGNGSNDGQDPTAGGNQGGADPGGQQQDGTVVHGDQGGPDPDGVQGQEPAADGNQDGADPGGQQQGGTVVHGEQDGPNPDGMQGQEPAADGNQGEAGTGGHQGDGTVVHGDHDGPNPDPMQDVQPSDDGQSQAGIRGDQDGPGPDLMQDIQTDDGQGPTGVRHEGTSDVPVPAPDGEEEDQGRPPKWRRIAVSGQALAGEVYTESLRRLMNSSEGVDINVRSYRVGPDQLGSRRGCYLAALLGQGRGTENRPPCLHCERTGPGPFEKCVSVKGFYNGACMACKWLNKARGCSLWGTSGQAESRTPASGPTDDPAASAEAREVIDVDDYVPSRTANQSEPGHSSHVKVEREVIDLDAYTVGEKSLQGQKRPADDSGRLNRRTRPKLEAAPTLPTGADRPSIDPGFRPRTGPRTGTGEYNAINVDEYTPSEAFLKEQKLAADESGRLNRRTRPKLEPAPKLPTGAERPSIDPGFRPRTGPVTGTGSDRRTAAASGPTSGDNPPDWMSTLVDSFKPDRAARFARTATRTPRETITIASSDESNEDSD